MGINIRIGSSWRIISGSSDWDRWNDTEFFVYGVNDDGEYRIFVYKSDVDLPDGHDMQTLSKELFVNMIEITPLTTKKPFV